MIFFTVDCILLKFTYFDYEWLRSSSRLAAERSWVRMMGTENGWNVSEEIKIKVEMRNVAQQNK